MRLLRLQPSAAVKEKRLAALLAGRDPSDVALREAVADAQLLGSLQLSGFDFAWDVVRGSRAAGSAPEPILGLRRAQAAVEAQAPYSTAALRAWHAPLAGAPSSFRSTDRACDGRPAPAPPRFIEARLATLESWLNFDSGRELSPVQAGALVLARLVEILPFDDGNGRVARLAASHVMVRAGSRPPILVGADAARLAATLGAAFRLDTEPLTALLGEAAERALDVMIQTLEGRA